MIIKCIVLFAIGMFSFSLAQAQGTVYLSSLNPTSTGSDAVGNDSWMAAGFETGNNLSGYSLNAIQLGMTGASGKPGGFRVMLYGLSDYFGAILPGTSLGSLSGSSDPETAGIYTYTDDSNITLSPKTFYFIVLTAGTGTAQGAYNWSTSAYTPSGSWFQDNAVLYSPDGVSDWNPTTYSGIAQFAINVTDVPEPSAEMLLGGGGILLLGFARWKARAIL